MNVIKNDSEGEAKGLRRTVVLCDYSPSFGLALVIIRDPTRVLIVICLLSFTVHPNNILICDRNIYKLMIYA